MKRLIAIFTMSLIGACSPNKMAVQPQGNGGDINAENLPAQPVKNPSTIADSNSEISWVEVPVDYRPGMGPDLSDEDWVKANNEFGLALLADQPFNANTVISPFSVERAVGMALEAAAGKTALGLLTVLKLPNAQGIGLAGKNIEKKILNLSEKNILEIDNRIWLNPGIQITADYRARLLSGYDGKFEIGPLSEAVINTKIQKLTHDKISDLIPPGAITSDTRSVLTNAVYFKAPWAEAFFDKGNTSSKVFSGLQVKNEVMMMYSGKFKSVYHDRDYDSMDLPFATADGKAKFVLRVVLPKENGLPGLKKAENSLQQRPVHVLSSYYEHVYLYLPRFKIAPQESLSLAEFFAANGAGLAFNEGYQHENWEFRSFSESLFISDIFHKAFIAIDEEGGEAAAATAVIMNKTKSGKPHRQENNFTFEVNRPFIFMIVEQNTGVVLFAGRVVEL